MRFINSIIDKYSIEALFSVLTILFLFFYLTGCSTTFSKESKQESLTKTASSIVSEITDSAAEIAPTAEKRIKFSFATGEVIVLLEKNLATEDLLSKLPLRLDFEDFAQSEKIAYLKNDLDTSETIPTQPQIGDFSLYIPWMTLVFYYDVEGTYPNNIIKLGKVESGTELLESLAGMVNVEMVTDE